MAGTIDLAQQLIKATGLTLKNEDEYKLSHINVSKSDNFSLQTAANVGDYIEDGDVVIKVVLSRRKLLGK